MNTRKPAATNYILITLDSCRWDTFQNAACPFMKRSSRFCRCWSHATFTMAAHQAFFAGKLPHSFDGNRYFDTAAAGHRGRIVRDQIWRLTNPESHRPSRIALTGRSIKDGFRQLGYTTIGTGAMNWFDPARSASAPLRDDFDCFAFFANQHTGDGRNIELQTEWAAQQVSQIDSPYFLFINVGETHHRYQAKGHRCSADWGDAAACRRAQQASLEYVDAVLGNLFAGLKDYFAVICGDHGDCWGEDNLWGHGFFHPKVMEVPMAIIDQSPRRGILAGLLPFLPRGQA
jgi:arylsulfatase A-like enzyme